MDDRKKNRGKAGASVIEHGQGRPQSHVAGRRRGHPIPPPYASYDEEEDDTVVDLSPKPAALQGKHTDPKEANHKFNKSDFVGFDDDDDDEDTLLLPQRHNQPIPTTRSRGGAKRLSPQHSAQDEERDSSRERPLQHIPSPQNNTRSTNQTTPLSKPESGSNKPSSPLTVASNVSVTPQHQPSRQLRKLGDLKGYHQDFGIDSDNTVSSPRVIRDTHKKAPKADEQPHSPFDVPPDNYSLNHAGRDAAQQEGFDDGPTTPSLHSPAGGFDSISETEVAGFSQTHSLDSDEAAPNYIEKESTGLLKVFAPENAKVYVDGVFQGAGNQLMTNADPYTLYQIRVLCPGYRPWTGTASLQGKQSLDIHPALKRRG